MNLLLLLIHKVKMIQQIIVSLQMFERISVSISDHSSRDLIKCVDNAMILSEGKIVAKGTTSTFEERKSYCKIFW